MIYAKYDHSLTYCKSYGAQATLAEPRSKGEVKAITRYLKKTIGSEFVWLGAKVASDHKEFSRTDFKYILGSSMIFEEMN